jgi:hypothetical protein
MWIEVGTHKTCQLGCDLFNLLILGSDGGSTPQLSESIQKGHYYFLFFSCFFPGFFLQWFNNNNNNNNNPKMKFELSYQKCQGLAAHNCKTTFTCVPVVCKQQKCVELYDNGKRGLVRSTTKVYFGTWQQL